MLDMIQRLFKTLLAVLVVLAAHAQAQEYPAKPVRFISPYPPGGVVDIAARVIAAKLAEMWKQQVVVENRSGGGGIVGTDHAAKSAPDGYTFLFATVSEFCITPFTYAKLPYDVQRDLAPVTVATETPLMWAANSAAPFATLQEMIAYSKSLPAGLSYSSPGLGTLNHLAAERFTLEFGAHLVHVPYKGGGPAGTAVAAGEVPLGILAMSSAVPHIKSGRVKTIAVTDASQWVAMAAPRGTARSIIEKTNADVRSVLRMPETRERLNALGSEPGGSTPEELAARIRTESEQFAKIVERIRLKLD